MIYFTEVSLRFIEPFRFVFDILLKPPVKGDTCSTFENLHLGGKDAEIGRLAHRSGLDLFG